MIARRRPRGTKSRELKEQGIEQVLENEKQEWREAAYVYIAKLPYGLHMTGEGIRLKYFAECDPGEPHHPNVWGAVISVCLQRGFLEKTGKFVKSKTVARHANEVPVLLTGAWKNTDERGEE